jgi:hypothetical protein
MTAIPVSGNKRFVAIAERGVKADCSIYDIHSLRNRKKNYDFYRKRISTKMQKKFIFLEEFIALAFSLDGKRLAILTGGPDYNLNLWAWER